MNLERLTWLIAFLGLLVLGVLSLSGYVNITFAIVLSGLYIGGNAWLGLDKIASKMSAKK
ncbi:MAG: hypothetical protein UX01_C0008G0026 [Candidatus Collierbacteria bacterium GW2011_GWB2_45_17]|uniref:Uncharacterized protein n=2 Tax=Candidatus Collieribacteriota TaxID=1752725 RepID=A0A0G1KQF4_9BACT|nr:MAG: hypothetical protein UW48_C0010G0012 [Microgenomates group bacterium GW2011_GWC1_44_23]KKT85778.1 MAG: hypothetical protein UW84_C0022G0010 [Candidatus Collierbacteria bacterium GW2011_GWA2_44_99]KKT94558.1 MAG: hypothetical protein UW96_C0019G0003 [Candidatus Collierbacteria bacterium GW2011_GWA1_45_15]KKT99658.1 MAG: hypothetical protein UX01_C0008G0026 [Candidatus Collierbacteria bacterium GW2011_GWB2_45_17]KKU07164.1 MAG: hypothetical protein UX11_C0019G0004 [Candidatus Collierbacte